MGTRPKVSIVVPIHPMANGEFFLWRLVNSLTSQTFKDWELIITKDGKMAENTNSGIKRARGELIKILFLDDYFSSPSSLEEMVHTFDFKDNWMIVGSDDNQTPRWTEDIANGNNKLGSPSALMMKSTKLLFFDEAMSWLLDCDLYKRLEKEHGRPRILPGNYITLGKGDHQMTHILTDTEKLAEHILMKQKHG